MSIYHRYALCCNLRRYLDDIDKLGDLVSQCDIVDDTTENGVSVDPDLPAIKQACEDPGQDPESAPLGDGGQKENAEKRRSRASQNDQKADEDKENHRPHNDHKSLEEDKPGRESDIKFDEAPNRSTMTPGVATTNLDPDRACPGVGAQFKITRSQLNRVLACNRILNRLNTGLVKNIHRIEAEENELSSQTIQHFWREAARLNGTEKIKSLRVMEREMAISGWWEDESSRESIGISVPALGNTNKTAGSVARAAPRPPSSPLQNPIEPDDLLWEDQVQQWRLDMGRLMDDQGRRYVKI